MNVRDYRRMVEAELARKAARSLAEGAEQQAGPERWDKDLDSLRDRAIDFGSRLGALYRLQAGAFDLTHFAPFAASFIAALQFIAQLAEEPEELRRAALDYLTSNGDEVANRVLVAGLEGAEPAAVPPAAALEMLARNDHSSAVRLARTALQAGGEVALREQAARILGSDPASASVLEGLLKDRGEAIEVRRASAVALRALQPEAFRTAAQSIVDADEATEIKATMSRGLRGLGMER